MSTYNQILVTVNQIEHIENPYSETLVTINETLVDVVNEIKQKEDL